MKATIERAVAITEATFTIAPSERSKGQGIESPYTVTIQAGRAHCTCPGYHYTGHCYHTDKILEAIRELVTVPQPEAPYDAPHCPQCGWLYAFGNVSHLCDECKAKQPEIPLSERTCDRCHKTTDQWREQNREVLCERCIRELERNAGIPLSERGQLNGDRAFSLLR